MRKLILTALVLTAPMTSGAASYGALSCSQVLYSGQSAESDIKAFLLEKGLSRDFYDGYFAMFPRLKRLMRDGDMFNGSYALRSLIERDFDFSLVGLDPEAATRFHNPLVKVWGSITLRVGRHESAYAGPALVLAMALREMSPEHFDFYEVLSEEDKKGLSRILQIEDDRNITDRDNSLSFSE